MPPYLPTVRWQEASPELVKLMEKFSQHGYLKSKPQPATDRRRESLVVLQIRTPSHHGQPLSRRWTKNHLQSFQPSTYKPLPKSNLPQQKRFPSASQTDLAGRPRERQPKPWTTAARLVKSPFDSLIGPEFPAIMNTAETVCKIYFANL